MSSLIDTVASYSQELPSSAPRAEEEDGILTLNHGNWPVVIDENYDDFIRFFGYNPENWVVENPGKMSKWQTSKRTEDGDRDVIWLYSYSGVRFRRKTEKDILTDQQLDEAVERVRGWDRKPLIRRVLGKGLGSPTTYAHVQGDEQGGKSEGGGIAGLAQREEESLERSLEYIKSLMHRGVNIEAIADIATGDKVENIYGHYNNQSRTTETLRKQNAYAVDSDVRRIKAFADFGLPVILPRTPSNHGEHRQSVGSAPHTSASDNLDLQIAETVKRVLQESPVNDQLVWHIPHDEIITNFDLSGVPCSLTHGHKINGGGSAAINKWVFGQTHKMMRNGIHSKVMFMGHFHHFYAEEVSGTTVLMSSSLDGGSPYFENMSGQTSMPGLLGVVIGPDYPLGFSYLSFL